jgi:cobalt-zinc-cadmium resistance protein CzcA
LCQSPGITDVEGDLESFVNDSDIDTTFLPENPVLAYVKQQVEVAGRQKKLETSRALPDLRLGYFTQTLIGTQNVNGQDQYFGSDHWFQGFQVGLSIPLWFFPHTSRIRAADFSIQAAQKNQAANELMLTQQYNQAIREAIKNKRSVDYYTSTALETADLLTRQSRKAFESGELDYTTLLLNLRQALSIQEGYLTSLQQYNQSIITLQYLNGNK